MPSITMDLINHSLYLMMQKYNYFLNIKIFFTLNFELRLLAIGYWLLAIGCWLLNTEL